MSDAPRRSAAPSLEIPSWMGEVRPDQIGFPFAPDRSRYRKQIEIEYKHTARGPLHLDTYLPERPPGSPGAAPLVVMIHGGAWQGGGRHLMGLTRWAGFLAAAGLAVVSIDYRLAPRTTYPDSFRDCLDALDWCIDHADDLGVDAERMALWGDSAGGHLALLVAASQSRPDFPGPRLRNDAARLRGTVAWYPPTDLLRLHRAESRSALAAGTVRAFVGADPEAEPARWREVSPLEQAHAAMPATLLLQGTRDLLVPHPHTIDFARRLGELGVDHELHVVEEAVHGFDRVAPGEEARTLILRSRDFLLERLGGPAPSEPR